MYIFKRRNLGLIVAIVLLTMAGVVSCQGETPALPSVPASSPAPTITAPTLQPTPSPTEAIVIPMPQPQTPYPSDMPIEEQAREALANQLGVSSEEIGVVEVEEVEWPDTSLGCPEPGMVYAQVITPGYRIVLEAAGENYEYHSDTQGRVVYCEPQGPGPILGGRATETVEFAREDLARRLGVPLDSIAVVAVVHQEFPVHAFYCRTMKERISREESLPMVSGESILLSAAGREYEYHASDRTVIFCRQLP